MNLQTIASCPNSPNCVSTQSKDSGHRIEPFAFSGDPTKAWERLFAIIKAQPRTRIVTQTKDYLHVEFTTLILRFVDDVEFVLVPNKKCIHFRSKSRVGYSDLGANRSRMEALRRLFNG